MALDGLRTASFPQTGYAILLISLPLGILDPALPIHDQQSGAGAALIGRFSSAR